MILLKQVHSGLIVKCPEGFSFTTLFFGFLVPICRGWYMYALLMFIVSAMTAGLAYLAFPFFINKQWLRKNLSEGYVPMDETTRTKLVRMRLVA